MNGCCAPPRPRSRCSRREGATNVSIELRQTLNDSLSKVGATKWVGLGSYFKGFGNQMVRRAGNDTLQQALDGLQRISGSA